MVRKVKCVNPRGSLIENNIYTLINVTIDDEGEEYYTVKEVKRGSNKFFSWRFEEIILEINNNIKVL